MDEKLVLEKIKKSEKVAFAFLEQLVNLDSGDDAKGGIADVCHSIGDFAAALGFCVEYITTPNEPTQVLCHRANEGKKKVMFIGHADTVFPKGTTLKRPFKIVGDKAYGPGVADMKGGLVTALFTIKALLEAGWEDSEFTFFICGDEELSHPHTNAVENFMKYAKGQDVCFCMEPGRENGAVVTGRKGAARPLIKVKGIASHAGTAPEKGVSANLELAYKIIELQKLNNKATGTTFNVGVMKGGFMANIISDYAECEVDIRAKTILEAEKAIKDVQRIVETSYVHGTNSVVEANKISFMPFETTSQVTRLYNLMRKEASLLGQEELKEMYSGGCSDVAWTALVGTTSLCGCGPKGFGAHTDEEYFHTASLVERMQLLAMTIMHLNQI
jgi:glutamate carboxypeptidase